MAYIDDIKKIASLLPLHELCGKNILVTGATGLVGSCIVKILLNSSNGDYQVFGAGRNVHWAKNLFKDNWADDRFHFLSWDIVESVPFNIDFHYIIHAASYSSPAAFINLPVEVMKSNIIGLINLLDYGRSHNMKRLLYVSSAEVYGEGDGRAFDEQYCGYIDNLSPRSCYSISKRAAETLCVSYSKEYLLDTVIARPCHIFGPDYSPSDNHVFAQFVNNAINKEDIVLKSAGQQLRSWCYVIDCASAIITILLKGSALEAYNIACDESVATIKELAEQIADISGKEVIVEAPTEKEKSAFNKISKSVLSTNKLKKLGWSPTFSFRQGIETSIKERSRRYKYPEND